MQRISHGKIVVVMICASLLLAPFIGIHETRAENEAILLIDPGFIPVSPGDNFTLTINATNVATMGAWQVVLKYNQTVMNVTAMWVPTDNVFGDPAVYQQQTVQPDYGVDFADGMGYAAFGNSRYVGEVSVTNGILCMVNCTALNEGAATIQLATRSNPVYKSAFTSGFASFLATWSEQYQEYRDIPQSLFVKSAVLTSGNTASRPIAAFAATPTLPEGTGHLVINGHTPIGETGYSQGYKTYPVTFNASRSIGMLTLDNGTKVLSNAGISEYHWDFGDGTNITTDNPMISYTYNQTGNWQVTLWVEDKETPPAASDTTVLIMVIGLVLDYFNWTPFLYTVFALIVALIVFLMFREIRGYLRTRRELRARRLSSKRLSPPSSQQRS